MTKTSILVVEDELIVAENLKVTLSGMGYHVPETACNSCEALEQAERHNPDLILMDIVLEGSEMDGVETARRIRKKHGIPVIFVTAYADNETLERVKVIAPFAYILKPFNERELYSAIELALHRHQLEEEIRKRDEILFAISFSIEWFLRAQRQRKKGDANNQDILEAGIIEVLEHVGLAVNANMVAVYRMNLEKEGITGGKIQYNWVAPGTPHIMPQVEENPAQLTFTTSLWRTLLSTGNSIAGDIAKFPEEERKFFESCGITSIAMLPLFRNDTFWGFITISSAVRREWSDSEMEALMVAGSIVGAILE